MLGLVFEVCLVVACTVFFLAILWRALQVVFKYLLD